ncbi:OapC/ArvC family zinc-ribbon domain-containing protein [Natrononativus amylolyticus]|uniref:OapC/ArvC family zinc-ribbon domain-containing protein n=1 Tax=Natrononativus amylolyticus TaxID=2963434 RepID=UPI0020CD16E8|nr:Zn-ribbon containing protein [Natrononativus amylolyticus]
MPHQCTTCGRTFPDGSKEMLSGCPDCGGNKFQFTPAGASDDAGDSGEIEGDEDRSAADRSVADRSVTEQVDRPTATSVEEEAPASSDTDASHSSVGPGDRAVDRAEPDRAVARSSETGFAEWPETARPPEDRESTPESAADVATTTTEVSPPIRSPSPDSSRPSTETQEDEAQRSPEPDDRTDGEDSAQADARSEVVSPEELPSDQEGSERPPNHGRVVSEPSGEEQSLEDLREELNDQFESIKIVSPGQYELNLMELYDREEYIVSLQEDGRYVINVPDSWRDGSE